MTPLMGTIVFFAGETVPEGWAACDGRLLQIAPNQALFSLIGPAYGGDGIRTFALPRLASPLPAGRYMIALTGQFPMRP